MNPLQQIVAVVDPGMQPGAALPRAAELARRSGARLRLFMGAYAPMIDAGRDLAGGKVRKLARNEYLEIRRHWLDRQAAPLIDAGLRVDCEVIWTSELHQALIAYAWACKADLVIKDLMPPRKGATRMPLSAADWRVARTCPSALMFVRQDSGMLPRRIAAAVDVGLDRGDSPHPLNEVIAGIGAGVAALAGAELHVVHAFPYRRPLLAVEVSGDLRALYADVHRTAQANFRRFTHEHGIAADRQHWITTSGDVADALARFARAQAIDLLVIGSSYHSIISRLLLGSAAEGILRHADCDVLLVKPADFGEQLRRQYDLAALLDAMRFDTVPTAAAA
ncbi:universal stress protein [Solimonas soli]|uniref:universal stress protein n=1 Tax=Solimonas soli TaxID=413479 RepID=UPI00146FC74D|nr:universal stress protein [Solimonas soli]